jgi:S-adenosylmethionine decarboxylase
MRAFSGGCKVNPFNDKTSQLFLGLNPWQAMSEKGVSAMKSLGRQLILELFDCPASFLDDPKHVERTMIQAVEKSGATLIKPFFHQFAPQGVSGVVVISESHFSIHTWPEYGYAAVDVFTCGEVIDINLAVECLRHGFGAGSVQKMELSRGMLDLPSELIRHKPEPLSACGSS